MGSMSDIVYPLTAVDSTFCPYAYTTAHLLRSASKAPFDVSLLCAAIERAANKWKLIGARVMEDESGQFCIKIPTNQLPKPVFKLTTATYDTCLNWAPVATAPFNISARPPKHYFFDPATPNHLSIYAQEQHPLLSVHVSHLRDATCIGFTLPHGAFDGIGRGLMMRAIQDELAGREWTPPPLLEWNIFAETLVNLPKDHDSEPIKTYKNECPKPTLWNTLRFLCGHLYEKYWHKVETKTLYLDEQTVTFLVKSVKEQARVMGKQVSTGDIIFAWFMKAALSNEPSSSDQVCMLPTISFRDVLAEDNPRMKSYPHNAVVACPMRPIPVSQIASMPPAELAVLHRAHITSVRTTSFLGAYAAYLGPPTRSPPIILARRAGVSTFLISNKAQVGTTTLDFGVGTETMGFWEMRAHLWWDMDHSMYINKFKGGYTIMGAMRRSRWEAVAKEAERLVNGKF